MKIALAQIQASKDVTENQQKALNLIDEAASNKAKIICFPEVQFYPFFPQYHNKDVGEYEINIDDEIVEKLKQKAKKYDIVVLPNFYLKDGENRYDASPVINSNGSLLGISKMVHVVQAECFYEQDYYTPSNDGFKVYDTAYGKIGIVICFDRHYPEAIRSCVLQGAEIIIIPTANTKDEPLEKFEWELRISAMQNSVYIAMCNRVGLEGKMDFCGESIIVDPNGDVITKANDQEQIVYADVDFGIIEKIKSQRPFLKLRRPEMYKPLVQ